MFEDESRSDFEIKFQYEIAPILSKIGEGFVSWLIVAVIFLVLLVFIQKRRQLSIRLKVISTSIVSAAMFSVTYAAHFVASFGEAFDGGVNHYRWYVSLIMNVITVIVFISFNLKNRSVETADKTEVRD